MSKIEAYPLCWPEGWKRTPFNQRVPKHSFQVTLAQARDHLFRQLELLGTTDEIISTNLPVRRRDGMFNADEAKVSDPGVAVYFKYQGKDMCFACDRYVSVRSNLRSIGLTVEAIRAIARHGASDMMERAFRGFTALPEHASQSWRYHLGFGEDQAVTIPEIDAAFRELAKKHHPDVGGNAEVFQQIVSAREQARKDLGA